MEFSITDFLNHRTENLQETMINKIMEWSNINTGSYNVIGLDRFAKHITEDFNTLGCEGDLFKIPPIEQIDVSGKNSLVDLGSILRFWKRSTAPIQVLLVGHMDTVFDAEHPFQVATRKNNKIINGPGVADMKGGLCILLQSLKLFEQTPFADKIGWEVILNPDEEIGSIGSSLYLEERAKSHHVGLVFEPSIGEECTLAGDRKGSGKYTIVVHGKAAHAGRELHRGKNAIVALSNILNAIDNLNGKREGVTFNIGYIHGGGAVNVVPNLAMCRLDVRIQNNEDKNWVKERFESIIQPYQTQEGYQVSLYGGIHRKPKTVIGKTKELFELVKSVGLELGQTITWKATGGVSDGNNLSEVGLPNVDTLGVCGGKIHSEEEYCLIDSLIPRVKLTTQLLIRLCEGKFTRSPSV